MQKDQYFIGFSKIPQIGPIKFKLIKDFFGDLELAWKANFPELLASGIKENDCQEIIKQRNQIDLNQEIELLQKLGINWVTIEDNNYPKLLKEIYDPPFIIYFLGDIKPINYLPCLAVVGTRKNTSYGQRVVEDLVSQLSYYNIGIISGLAFGIDALAHKIAITKNGFTAAVLGSDLNWKNIGPKSNHRLAQEILEKGGCLISENSLGSITLKSNFAIRNRIISGISKAVLIIEAGKESGTIITANCALDQGRDVYAVPGNIYNHYCEGTNELIKKGAKAVTQISDILEDLKLGHLIKAKSSDNTQNLTETEKNIIFLLKNQSLHIDKIAQICNIRINVLSSILSVLEIKGLIKNSGGGNYFSLKK